MKIEHYVWVIVMTNWLCWWQINSMEYVCNIYLSLGVVWVNYGATVNVLCCKKCKIHWTVFSQVCDAQDKQKNSHYFLRKTGVVCLFHEECFRHCKSLIMFLSAALFWIHCRRQDDNRVGEIWNGVFLSFYWPLL